MKRKKTKGNEILKIENLLTANEKVDVSSENFKKIMFIYSVGIKEIQTKLEIIQNEFKIFYDYNLIDHITTRIKSPESIKKKMAKKDLEFTYNDMIKNINDIAGIRVICPLKKDIYSIRNLIEELPGIEIQKDVAEMASRSVELNNLQNIMQILNEDVKSLSLEKNSFDYVVTNPPYKKIGTGIINKEDKQIISRHETTVNLDEWLKVASNLLKDNGAIYMVHRPERLNEIIENLRKYRLEPKRIRFVYPKVSKDANLVLIKAVKYANSFLKVEKPLIIYNEDGSYTDEILKIYEEGK